MLVILLLMTWARVGEAKPRPLRVTALVPFSASTGPYMGGVWRSTAVAISVATEEFNARNFSTVPSLAVPENCDLELELTFTDSMSTGLGSTFAVIEALYESRVAGGPSREQRPDAIIGPARSASSTPVATVLGLFEMPQVSYWATSPRLDDTSSFPYFARTLAPDTSSMLAAAQYFQYVGWDSVVLLYVNDDYGQNVATSLLASALEIGIVVTPVAFTEGNEDSIKAAVLTVAQSGLRAIFVIAFSEPLKLILNESSTRGLFGDRYAWSFSDAIEDSFFVENAELLRGAVKIGQNPVSSHIGPFGESFKGFDEARYNAYGGMQDSSAHSFVEPGYFASEPVYEISYYGIDAVVTVGLAACAARKKLVAARKNGTADELNIPSGPEIFAELRHVEFEGLSGTVKFDQFSSRSSESTNFNMKNVVKKADNSYAIEVVGGWSASAGWFNNLDGGNLSVTYYDGSHDPPPERNPSCREVQGSNYFDYSSFACVNCPVGSEARADEKGCDLCKVGTARRNLLDAACGSCARATELQPRVGASRCDVCPVNSERAGLEGEPGVSLQECVCNPGFYSKNWSRARHAVDDHYDDDETDEAWGASGSECAECPEGASCRGSSYAPRNKKDWWGDPLNPVEFYECGVGKCESGFKCAQGWKGAMCEYLKSPDYYAISEFGPFTCPTTTAVWQDWLFVGCAFCGVVAVWIYVNFRLLDRYASIDLLTYHLQLTAIVQRFAYRHFPSRRASAWVFLLDLALFDIDVFKPTCITSWSFERGVNLQFLLIVAFIAYEASKLAFQVLGKSFRDPSFRNWRDIRASMVYDTGDFGPAAARCFSSIMSLIDIQHTTITYNAFAAFQCAPRRGLQSPHMVYDPETRCDSAAGRISLISNGLAIAIIVLGVPHAVFFEIRRAYAVDAGVHAPKIQERLGWALAPYRSPHHSWRIRRTYLTIYICAVSTFVTNPLFQVMLALFGLNHAHDMHEATRPYIQERLNTLESWGFGFVILVVNTSVLIAEYERFSRTWFNVVIAAQIVYFGRTVFAALVERRKRVQTARLLKSLQRRSEGQEAGGSSFFDLPSPLRSFHSTRKAADHSIIANDGGCDGDDDTAELKLKRREAVEEMSQTFEPAVLQSFACRKNTGARRRHRRQKAGGTPPSADDGDLLAAARKMSVVDECDINEHGNRNNDIASVVVCDVDDDAADDNKKNFALFEKVALEMQYIICDQSKTSAYSVDHRAEFWKLLVQPAHFHGIIDYVTTLPNSERTAFFLVLNGLQSFLEKRTGDPHGRVMHAIVTEADRSSYLYYLCSCDEPAFDRAAELLRVLAANYQSRKTKKSVSRFGRALRFFDSLHLDVALRPSSSSSSPPPPPSWWRRLATFFAESTSTFTARARDNDDDDAGGDPSGDNDTIAER